MGDDEHIPESRGKLGGTEPLTDEDRVREALRAAVDVRWVPPVHTDLAEIVERGRRRARLRVLAASASAVGAVVLIAAVALGLTMFGRLAEAHRVDSATGGPSRSLIVTTAPAPSTSPASCVFPDWAAEPAFLRLPTASQQQWFVNRAQEDFAKASLVRLGPVTTPFLAGAKSGTFGTRISASGATTASTVTFQWGEVDGTPSAVAAGDMARYGCVAGNASQNYLTKGTVINTYWAGGDGRSDHQRVVVYARIGARVAVIEVDEQTFRSAGTSTGQPSQRSTANVRADPFPAPLPTAELTTMALNLSSFVAG